MIKKKCLSLCKFTLLLFSYYFYCLYTLCFFKALKHIKRGQNFQAFVRQKDVHFLMFCSLVALCIWFYLKLSITRYLRFYNKCASIFFIDNSFLSLLFLNITRWLNEIFIKRCFLSLFASNVPSLLCTLQLIYLNSSLKHLSTIYCCLVLVLPFKQSYKISFCFSLASQSATLYLMQDTNTFL